MCFLNVSKAKKLIKNIQGYDFLFIYKVEQNARIKIKLLAVHHLQTGKTIQEVSKHLLYDRRNVRHWHHMFVLFNYEGLIVAHW